MEGWSASELAAVVVPIMAALVWLFGLQSRLIGHERECAQRYSQLDERHEALTKSLDERHATTTASLDRLHDKIDRLMERP